MSYDIPSPKGFFNEQVKCAREGIYNGLMAYYIQNQPDPLNLGITVVNDLDAIQAALGVFHDKGWYAVAMRLLDRNVVRIWEKDFDYESWLCEAGQTWMGGDEERFMVAVKPNIFDPSEEKIISVCGKCKDLIDEAKGKIPEGVSGDVNIQ